jgi:paraquat-inducible protein B
MAANRQTAVGAFVLGGLVLVVSAIVLFGKFHLFNPVTRAAIVFQDSISGLSIGAPVTFRGVRVGSVESIALEFDVKTHTAYIPVTVQLEPDRVSVTRGSDRNAVNLAILIKRGLRAQLNTQSFVTGQSQVDLDFDTASAAVFHPEITNLPEIPAEQSTLQRVKEQLSQLPLRELADNTGATLQSLRALSEKLNVDLPPLLQSAKATSDRSAQTADAATLAIKDLQERMNATLGAISQLVATSDQQLTQRGAELHTLLASSNQTVLQARDMINDMRALTSSRATTRANLDSTLRDLATAAASLRGFASDVEHNPQLLLTGRRQ